MYVASPNPLKCGVNWQVLMWLVVAWWGRRVWHLSIWRTACVCIIFHGQSQLSRLSLWFLSSSLSVVMNKIALVTDWLNQESIGGAYFGSALTIRIGGLGISPHLWPFRKLTFPSGYTAKWALPQRQGGGCTQLAQVYFWSEEDVWVGRKCAQLFFLY